MARLKDQKPRKLSSRTWLERQLADPYVARAKKEGYRSRAAFKLIEIDDKYRLLKHGARVVDLSADYRLTDPAVYEKWYGHAHTDSARLKSTVYGLPELWAERIPGQRLIANPGCYATSVILGLAPLAKAGWISSSQTVVCDCKSGASGAGKDPRRELHFAEVDENLRAYNLFSHRHTPEISQHTGLAHDKLVFTTHLLPVVRGILSTLYISLNAAQTGETIERTFREFYAGHPMVRVWKAGSLPELRHAANTNF